MKYSSAFAHLSDILAASGLPLYPVGLSPDTSPEVFGEVSFAFTDTGVNSASVGGVVLVDINIQAGAGPLAAYSFADALDEYLVMKSYNGTQFFASNVAPRGFSQVNPTLLVYEYSVPFKHFGVI